MHGFPDRRRGHCDTPITFSEPWEQPGRLLKMVEEPHPASPPYPFHHLTTDGLWMITTAAAAAAVLQRHLGECATASIGSGRAELGAGVTAATLTRTRCVRGMHATS